MIMLSSDKFSFIPMLYIGTPATISADSEKIRPLLFLHSASNPQFLSSIKF